MLVTLPMCGTRQALMAGTDRRLSVGASILWGMRWERGGAPLAAVCSPSRCPLYLAGEETEFARGSTCARGTGIKGVKWHAGTRMPTGRDSQAALYRLGRELFFEKRFELEVAPQQIIYEEFGDRAEVLLDLCELRSPLAKRSKELRLQEKLAVVGHMFR